MNYSAPHGAGRVLSRTQAYEQIKLEEFEKSMEGIYSESVNDFTRDESPMVYKPAEEIIANITDTVSIRKSSIQYSTSKHTNNMEKSKHIDNT